MKIEDALSRLVFLAGLALFVGVGFLAWKIGETWDQAATQSLVSGLVAVCGGGTVIVGTFIALIVGVPLAMRYFVEGSRAQRAWRDNGGWQDEGTVLPARRVPAQGVRQLTVQGNDDAQRYNEGYNEWGVYQDPPRLASNGKSAEQIGSWQSPGPQAYDLWEEEDGHYDGQ